MTGNLQANLYNVNKNTCEHPCITQCGKAGFTSLRNPKMGFLNVFAIAAALAWRREGMLVFAG
jgi:hypothetical protein